MTSIYKTKILQGHGRPIKDIKFSPDGKFIFSASSDRTVIKWDSKTNNKLFTYPHQASVNVICIAGQKSILFSGDATGCVYAWNFSSDNLIRKVTFDALFNIRDMSLSTDEENILITFAERAKKSKSRLDVYLVNDMTAPNSSEQTPPNLPSVIKRLECMDINTKFVKGRFINFNKNILISREDGVLEMYNFPQGILISSQKFHSDEILDFDVNDEYGIIITSSKDGEMSLINLNTFQLINKFKPTNPVRNLNACKLAIIKNPYYRNPFISQEISIDSLFDLNFPDLNQISFVENAEDKAKKEKYGKTKEFVIAIVAGGQDSKFVTVTEQKEGGFEIIIYNALTGEKLVDFLDHFGPVNTLSVYQNTLASGAEDATVRIHSIEHYLFEK